MCIRDRVKNPGELTYQLCEQYVDDIVTVTEDETAAAILSLLEIQKLVADGAVAVPVAAVLFHMLPLEGKKVVCVISGGNIDVNILNRVITRGLVTVSYTHLDVYKRQPHCSAHHQRKNDLKF